MPSRTAKFVHDSVCDLRRALRTRQSDLVVVGPPHFFFFLGGGGVRRRWSSLQDLRETEISDKIRRFGGGLCFCLANLEKWENAGSNFPAGRGALCRCCLFPPRYFRAFFLLFLGRLCLTVHFRSLELFSVVAVCHSHGRARH